MSDEVETRYSGWDAQAIGRIAKDYYGGMEQMFAHHGWPERGSKMMISAPRHIVAKYGDIEAFVLAHPINNAG